MMGALTRERGQCRVKMGKPFSKTREGADDHSFPPFEEALIGLCPLKASLSQHRGEAGFAVVGGGTAELRVSQCKSRKSGVSVTQREDVPDGADITGYKNPRGEESLLAPVGLPSV
ncbi:hypothetical protein STEG23_025057 [Scotinomys teguina]